jgi:ubiquinone/menaquinone biosynthesis C-methylase UbiE
MTYDRQVAKIEEAGRRAMRQRLLADAAGQVLEIGAGTGANLPCCGPKAESLTVTEPIAPMVRQLEHRVSDRGTAVEVLRASALRELRRVLRPGGKLLFLEHVRSDDPARARLQDRMNWINRLVAMCDCNRPTLGTIRQAGFTVTSLEHTVLPKTPKFLSPAIIGVAAKSA